MNFKEYTVLRKVKDPTFLISEGGVAELIYLLLNEEQDNNFYIKFCKIYWDNKNIIEEELKNHLLTNNDLIKFLDSKGVSLAKYKAN